MSLRTATMIALIFTVIATLLSLLSFFNNFNSFIGRDGFRVFSFLWFLERASLALFLFALYRRQTSTE
jgi:hypothetical protein